MKLLICSSEAEPFAKSGGLGDVIGSLPSALSALGHDVRVVIPKYRAINNQQCQLELVVKELVVDFGAQRLKGNVYRSLLPDSDTPIYFIENERFFNRKYLYGSNGSDYEDNHLRFGFFSMASIWMLKALDWTPDVIMCNEWQTALVPAYLKNLNILRFDPFYHQVKTLFTVHNLAYQGLFDRMALFEINLPPQIYNSEGVEFYKKINLMKAGIIYADWVSTVSARYAKEIQTEEYGCGLHGILKKRTKKLTGILNGLDYSVWNPEIDSLIPHNYGPENLAGKTKCKAELQKKCGLKVDPQAPLIGLITRLVDQKGLDLFQAAAEKLIALGCQFVILGTGMPHLAKMLAKLAKQHPREISVTLDYDNCLAHQIAAGSDMLLMPSLFEPCGIVQLYGLKYGALPIVRKTGGLADSIVSATPTSIEQGRATGFVFTNYAAGEMLAAVKKAVRLYREDQEAWGRLMKTAMTRDFSWDASAKLYEKLLAKIAKLA